MASSALRGRATQPTVLGDLRAEHPLWVVGRLVDENVLRLRRADHVVVQLLVEVDVRLGAGVDALLGGACVFVCLCVEACVR